LDEKGVTRLRRAALHQRRCNDTAFWTQVGVQERRSLQSVQPLRPAFDVGLSGSTSDVVETHHAISKTGVKILVFPPRRSMSSPRAARLERRLFQAVAPIPDP